MADLILSNPEDLLRQAQEHGGSSIEDYLAEEDLVTKAHTPRSLLGALVGHTCVLCDLLLQSTRCASDLGSCTLVQMRGGMWQRSRGNYRLSVGSTATTACAAGAAWCTTVRLQGVRGWCGSRHHTLGELGLSVILALVVP